MAEREQDTETQLRGEEAEGSPEDAQRWYVIHTYSGYENKVQANLKFRIETMDMRDKILEVVIPTADELEVKDGQRRTVARKVFPGYVLVKMLMTDDSWSVVRNTPGVTGFVGSGGPGLLDSRNRPTPLEDWEVKTILRQMEAEAPRIKVGFSRGQSVRIIDGPFADFVGQVDTINLEKGKVRLMVSFFGRETPVELELLQVEKL